jgi:hypothetical protein
MRARMVDWIIEVMSVYNYLNDTFFLAVYIMDKFFSTTTQIMVDKDVHLLGILCMYLATKEEEIIPFFLNTI